MTDNANIKPLNISRQKCQRRKLGRTALLGLSINLSKDLFAVKLAEQKGRL